MEGALAFPLLLAVVIATAKGAGYLSNRLGQPAVLGELLAGLLLGPSLLNLFHLPPFADQPILTESLTLLANLGVLVLMFIAGLEVELTAMRQAGRASVLAGVLGVLFPILMAPLISWPAGHSFSQGLFLGLILAATSVSISAQTLMELGVLRSRVGLSLLGGAVVDDVLVILFLSLFLAFTGGDASVAVLLSVIGRMLLFFVIATGLGFLLLPPFLRWVHRLPISEGLTAAALSVAFLYAWAAEALGGVAAITGAFLAGALMGQSELRPRLHRSFHVLAYAFLVPIFFVNIGLEANLRTLGREGALVAGGMIVVAVVSKLVGAGLGGWLGGLSRPEALRLGVGMISRGEVGLIVASLGIHQGLLPEAAFTGVILMVLATTLMTPILLRALYPTPSSEKGQANDGR